jgi:aspartate aminotransferase-like enzyme
MNPKKTGEEGNHHPNRSDEERSFTVTPWEVKGIVDYVKLIEEFGTEKITDRHRLRR